MTYADGEKATKTTSVIVGDDTTAPTTTVTLNGQAPASGYTSSVAVSLSATDGAAGTGVDWTEYRIDGGAWTHRDNSASASPFVTAFTVSTEGSHTVEFSSRDRAGNVETPAKSVTFSITFPAAAAPARRSRISSTAQASTRSGRPSTRSPATRRRSPAAS